MNAIVERGSRSLVLHTGGQRVSREDLFALPLPANLTDTHFPIPHSELVRQTIEQLEAFGVQVQSESHAIAKDGNRYFGVFGLGAQDNKGEFGLLVGLRNSHDRSFLASLALGQHVFVCDNLSFSGDVKIERKHTRFILRDLPGLMNSAVSKIVAQRRTMEERVEAYKQQQLDSRDVNNILVKAVESRIVPGQKILDVLNEYRNTKHQEFAEPNAWSLFNAFTEVFKVYNTEGLVPRSQKLYGLFDQVSHLATAA